jgi:hypothetical protein
LGASDDPSIIRPLPFSDIATACDEGDGKGMADTGATSWANASRDSDCAAAAILAWEATVGPIALGVLQPETTVNANQQVANLVARLREKNKAKAPTAGRCRQICL